MPTILEFVSLQCPYCVEPVELAVDTTLGPKQEYIQDCDVCCRPIAVSILVDRDGEPSVFADRSE